jgi:hypothetical protein
LALANGRIRSAATVTTSLLFVAFGAPPRACRLHSPHSFTTSQLGGAIPDLPHHLDHNNNIVAEIEQHQHYISSKQTNSLHDTNKQVALVRLQILSTTGRPQLDTRLDAATYRGRGTQLATLIPERHSPLSAAHHLKDE